MFLISVSGMCELGDDGKSFGQWVGLVEVCGEASGDSLWREYFLFVILIRRVFEDVGKIGDSEKVVVVD